MLAAMRQQKRIASSISGWVKNPQSLDQVWYSNTTAAWGGVGNNFAIVGYSQAQNPPGGGTPYYRSFSADGLSYASPVTQNINLYDPDAAGALYNGGSYVFNGWMAADTRSGVSRRYIISMCSSGGTVSDGNTGRVPSLGTSGFLWSSDGTVWTRGTMPVGNWFRIRNLSGIWVALSFRWGYIPATSFRSVDNRYAVSTDGLNWTLRTFPITWQVNDIAFDGATYVATGSNGSPKCFLSSNNLTDWTIRTLPVAANASTFMGGAAFGNGYFVAPSSSGSTGVVRSIDGVTWEFIPSTFSSPKGIEFVNNRFIAYTTSPGVSVSYASFDGASWSPVPNQQGPYNQASICGNRLIGVGFGDFATASLEVL